MRQFVASLVTILRKCRILLLFQIAISNSVAIALTNAISVAIFPYFITS